MDASARNIRTVREFTPIFENEHRDMTDDKHPSLEALVRRANDGDRDALEEVVRAVQDEVFHLAVRMLGSVDDARDATQEILVRVATKLGSFRGESSFETWVYRVATNALLNTSKSLRRKDSHFDELGTALDAAVASAGEGAPELAAMLDEAKQVCTQGMLLCLDRPHRAAYILGEILEIAGDEAAAVLEITAAAFRKRLSRARADMEAFAASRCGIANPANACRCRKLLPLAVQIGLVDPAKPELTRLPIAQPDRLDLEIEQLRTAAELFRSLPRFASPDDHAAAVRSLLAAGQTAN